jgi:hypothetical protein
MPDEERGAVHKGNTMVPSTTPPSQKPRRCSVVAPTIPPLPGRLRSAHVQYSTVADVGVSNRVLYVLHVASRLYILQVRDLCGQTNFSVSYVSTASPKIGNYSTLSACSLPARPASASLGELLRAVLDATNMVNVQFARCSPHMLNSGHWQVES